MKYNEPPVLLKLLEPEEIWKETRMSEKLSLSPDTILSSQL
jgi:hypothetical protein